MPFTRKRRRIGPGKTQKSPASSRTPRTEILFKVLGSKDPKKKPNSS